METGSIRYGSADVSYHVFGSGVKRVCCFHGYGETGATFSFLEASLGREFTFIAIDLPLHGNTRWPGEEVFLPADLLQILDRLLPGDIQTFSVLAYSMGARVALHLLQLIPERIDRLVMIAPDGLHENFWYWFATQVGIGNRLFKYTMQHPGWLLALAKIAEVTGSIHKNRLKFARRFLNNKEERIQLYKRWTVMHAFRPNLDAIKNICAFQQKPLHLLFGKYDRIILAKYAKPLEERPFITIRIIKSGHQLLKEAHGEQIAELLTQ